MRRLRTLGTGAVLSAWLGTASNARAGEATVPVDVGVGPAAHWMTGPIADDQTFHYGLKLNLHAVIDHETLEKNKEKIPANLRDKVLSLSEVKVSPSVFIPDTLVISPKISHTGMYGVVWRPIELGLPLVTRPFRFELGVGPVLNYTLIYSDLLPSPTHFLRLGLSALAEVVLPFSRSFQASFGWESAVYIPQKVGESPFAMWGSTSENLWHIGQAFLKFHVRFPTTVNL